MLLDASQAFDRLNYIKLFRKLIDKGLCPLICKILVLMHRDQSVTVRWGDTRSPAFRVSNGVKQGGNISPVLFTIYADSVLDNLRDSGLGCYIGHIFAGALAYADDIVLLSPSLSGLTEMLNIAEIEGDALDLKFNPSKCQLLNFGKSNDCENVSVVFCDKTINSEPNAAHLGHYIGEKYELRTVESAIENLNRKTNALLSKFGHCTPDVKYKLFNSYCMSCYGSVLWDYDHPHIENLYCAWRKCIRRIYSIPYDTHCAYLTTTCRDHTIETKLLSRYYNFIKSCLCSDNSVVRICSLLALQGSQSPVSNSLSIICSRVHLEIQPS